MNKYTLVGLSAAGGILCGLAWSSFCSGLILLVAFVPFFVIEEWLFENPGKYTRNAIIIYLLPGFVIFSILSMGWMRAASLTGAIMVIAGLAMLMTISLWLAHLVRIRGGNIPGFAAMVSIWLTYEFISLNVNIVSPWLNLGNGLAKDIMFIQWYEITGTSGGTLWILCSNLFITLWLVNYIGGKRRHKIFLSVCLLIVLVPAGFSVARYITIRPAKTDPSEVLIIQPNTDPFTEKFVVPFGVQLQKVISMAQKEVTGNTTWIISPETTVDDPVDLDSLNGNKYIRMIRSLTAQYPCAAVIIGLVSYKTYHDRKVPPTRSARITDSSGSYYDHFNSAFLIDTGRSVQFYHKSKLVPGIEMQFINGPGRLIGRILPYLGGTKWGYGIQNERSCLNHSGQQQKIAPIICYESVFGQFVTGYVQNGAGALFIITNDGWWKNTNGYQQHLYYASLRAIETRRAVARAANTGISCIIDIRGKRTSESKWWTPAIVRGDITPETRITPYVKYGDYLLRIGVLVSIIIMAAVFIIYPLRRKLN